MDKVILLYKMYFWWVNALCFDFMTEVRTFLFQVFFLHSHILFSPRENKTFRVRLMSSRRPPAPAGIPPVVMAKSGSIVSVLPRKRCRSCDWRGRARRRAASSGRPRVSILVQWDFDRYLTLSVNCLFCYNKSLYWTLLKHYYYGNYFLCIVNHIWIEKL